MRLLQCRPAEKTAHVYSPRCADGSVQNNKDVIAFIHAFSIIIKNPQVLDFKKIITFGVTSTNRFLAGLIQNFLVWSISSIDIKKKKRLISENKAVRLY